MMRRWLSSLLLAAMLLAQYGMVMHGLGHAMADAQPGFAQSGKPVVHAHAFDPLCDTCLAFVQMAGAITADLPSAALLSDLGYAPYAAPMPASSTAERPAPRSRGPPAA